MGNGRLPTFVVPGAMKAGTTALARYLGAHPQVFMPRAKELRYFDLRHEEGMAWYREQFAGAGDALAVGEATPTYLASPDALARMVETLPEAKVVVLLRDPVDRAYSHYWHERSRRREHRSFDEATADWATSDYLRSSRYVEPLRALERSCGRDRLHVVVFDDLCDEPRRTYADVCRFLGVADDVVPAVVGEQVNPHVRFRSLRVRRLGQRLPKRIGDAIGKVNRLVEPYPPLDDAVRHRLDDEFRNEIAELSAWLGRDLSRWTNPPVDAKD